MKGRWRWIILIGLILLFLILSVVWEQITAKDNTLTLNVINNLNQSVDITFDQPSP